MSRILQPFRLRAACRRVGPPTLALALAGVVAVVIAPITEAAAPAAPLSDCVKTDNGDPTLQSLTRTPAAVNVTTADRTVTFTVGAVDTGGPGAATGINSGFMGLGSADNQRSTFATLTKNAAGKWVGTATIPRWTHAGVWHVSYLSFSDKAGNFAFWTTDELAALGFSGNVNVTATPDDTAPSLNGFTFTPGSVNTTAAVKTVTVTADVSDAQSGVNNVYVSASQPATNHQGFASLTKVAGSATTYRGTMTVPRWQGNGTWHVNSVQVVDKVGNYRAYTYDQLVAAGFKRNLVVVSGTDTTLPSLVTFTRTPAAVDVRTADKTVNATMRVKDTGSGVSYVQLSFASADGPSASMYLHRTAGTANDGTWTGSSTVLRCFSSPGTWLASVSIVDVAGNSKTLDSAALVALGLPSQLTVQATDHVVPKVTGPSSQTPTGNIILQFNENVNGISAASATLRRSSFPNPGPALAGTWACRTGANVATSCATGQVRKATFNPTAALENFTSYEMELNPEHQLAVTDLAGNPFRRSKVYLFVSN